MIEDIVKYILLNMNVIHCIPFSYYSHVLICISVFQLTGNKGDSGKVDGSLKM